MSYTQTHVGIVAKNTLRGVGLEAILEEAAGLAARPVALDEAIAAADLAAVLLDSFCAADLPGALLRLRRERPEMKVVVLGDRVDADHVQSVIAAGAKGYLSEAASESDIRMALEVVLDGSVWAPRKVLARLIDAGGIKPLAPKPSSHFSDQMTHREHDVMRLLIDGQTNRQIAASLGVEQVTVKAHLGRMLRKAGVKNRVELTLKAMMGSAEEYQDEEEVY